MDWRFSTFLLFLFALLFAVTWATSQDGLCHSTYVLDVLAQQNKDGALNCFEFWFNRYQTLIGAIVALGAAAIAIIPARGQLRQMLRQSSASARQPMVDLAESLETEIAFLEDFRRSGDKINHILQFYDERDPADIYDTFGDEMPKARRAVVSGLRAFQTIKSRHPAPSDAFNARNIFLETIVDLKEALDNFDLAFRSEIGAIDEEFGEIELSVKEIRMARRNIGRARISWDAALDGLRNQLIQDVEAAWAQVRVLEAQALKS